MEIVSDDDDDNDSLFDAFMIVCQQESSFESSGDEDEATVEPCVWGDLGREGLQTSSANVCSILTCCSKIFGDPHQFTHLITSSFFKLPIKLFDEILVRVLQHDNYLRQKKDATGKIGLSAHQKVASALRLLTSGVSSMEHDDKTE